MSYIRQFARQIYVQYHGSRLQKNHFGCRASLKNVAA